MAVGGGYLSLFKGLEPSLDGCLHQRADLWMFGSEGPPRKRPDNRQAKPAWATRTGPAGAPQASNTLIYKLKIKLAALRLCVCLSWFKETAGLHSVRRTRVPTSIDNFLFEFHVA
jgi:hypothetical protein